MTARSLAAASVYLLAAALPLSIAGMNLALCAAALAALWSGPKIWRRALRAEVGWIGLYALWGFVSGAFGVDWSVSGHEAARELHKVCALAVMLCVLPEAPGETTGNILLGSFAAAAAIGIWQTAALSNNPLQWLRAHAFVHPVTFGEQMALAALGALALGLCLSKPGRFRASCLGLLYAAALLLSQTRAAAVGLAAGFAALCWAVPRLRRRAAWSGAFVLAAFLAWEVMPTGGRSLLEIARPKILTTRGQVEPQRARYVLWEVAWRAFEDHPLSGVGPGNYRTVFGRYFPPGEFGREDVWGSAHNLYLHQLAERGLVGELLLLLALAALIRRAAALSRSRPGPWTLWSLSALVAFAVMNLTEVAFQKEQIATLLLFLWAAAEADAKPGFAGKVL